jgi:hypothetical protein
MNRSMALVTATFLVAGMAGCQEAAKPAAVPAAAATPAPQVLEVVCGKTGTSVSTPRIVAAADGVHLRVRDESGGSGTYLGYSYGEGMGFGGGDPAGPGTISRVLTMPPGPGRLQCSHDNGDTKDRAVAIEVLDPAGYWKSGALAALGCTSPEVSMIDWVHPFGGGSTADEALADLARPMDQPVTSERVQNGYAAAAGQTYVLRRSGRPWATALVTRSGPNAYSAELGSLCGGARGKAG